MSKIAAIARTALIAAALAGAAAAPATAATSGTVKLQGTVALNCTVAVTDLNQSLNLVSGESARQVGEVKETCNSGTGYSISISSANGGVLKNENSGSVRYQVAYDGQANYLTTALAVPRATAQFGKTIPLTVSLDGSANAIAGSYSDTVTITIAAK